MSLSVIAYGGALCAAVFYGVATILQAMSVFRMAAIPSGASLWQRARAGSLYAVGLCCDGLGFLASAFALHTLPLFLVESMVASSVAVTALLAVVILRQRLRGLEWGAIAVLVAGLIALGMTAKEGTANSVSSVVDWCVLVLAVPAAGVSAWLIVGVSPRSDSPSSAGRVRFSGIVLALISGVGFGMVGISARLISVHSSIAGWLSDPLTWSLIAWGGISVVVYGYALDRLSTTTVAAMSFACETIIPSAVGLLWLGDEVRHGLWWLCAVGFIATLSSCVALASRSEVEAETSSTR